MIWNQDQQGYPLKCYSRLAHDEFSGWYSVSNKAKCNDFCFWNQIENVDGKRKGNKNGDWNRSTRILSNPHHTTTDSDEESLVWGCIIDAAGSRSGTTWTEVTDRFQKYDGKIFDHLQCELGVGEVLSSWEQRWVQSAVFWSILATLGFVALSLEILYFGYRGIMGSRLLKGPLYRIF